MDDEYDYLQPGFDPKSLTVPRLRSILVMLWPRLISATFKTSPASP